MPRDTLRFTAGEFQRRASRYADPRWVHHDGETALMLRQAQEDAEVLARLDSWLTTRTSPVFRSEPKETRWMMDEIAQRLARERAEIRKERP